MVRPFDDVTTLRDITHTHTHSETCLTWNTKKSHLYRCISCEVVRRGYEKQAKEEAKSTGRPSRKVLMSFGDENADGMTFGEESSSNGLSFGATNTNDTGLTFGTTSNVTGGGISFGTTSNDTGLTFGTTSSTSNDTGLTFGTTSTSNNTGLTFGTTSTSNNIGLTLGGSSSFQTPTTSKSQPIIFGTNSNLLKRHVLDTPTSRVLSPQLPRSKQGQVVSKHCGSVFTFGSGDCDQLGHGKVDDGQEMIAKVPTKVDLRPAEVQDQNICAVAGGGLHTVALTGSGEILSWGCNDDEALGRICNDHMARLTQFYAKYAPEKTSQFVKDLVQKYKGFYDVLYLRLYKKYGEFPGGESVPGRVQNLDRIRFVMIDCGDCHTAALSSDGRVYTFGTYKDSNGYIGFNASGVKKQLAPREVEGLYKINGPMTQISCGSHHTCAVSKSGLLLVWGDAEHGQLGQRVPSRLKKQGLRVHAVGFRSTLKLKKSDRRVCNVFCHAYCTFVTLSNGQTYAWGLNNYGQLGVGDRETTFLPKPITLEDGEQVAQITGGLHHSILLTTKGHVFTAGRGDSGQLGIPELEVVRGGNNSWTRVSTFDEAPVKEVAAGSNHCLALTHKGDLYSWGFGEMYQLGHDQDEDEPIPRKLNTAHQGNILSISAGGQHSVFVMKTK